MRAQHPRALFLLSALLSLFFTSCFGGHGGGGGGGNGGGNGGGGGNNSPVFTITVADSGNGGFVQGQNRAGYYISVANIGQVATSGNVQVTVTLPAGESLSGIFEEFVDGSDDEQGWTFTGGQIATATRADSLAPRASFPRIIVAVDVSLYATSPQVLMVSVSGGGAATANNQDTTSIFTRVSILIGKYAFLFSGFDANGAVSIAGSINVDVNGNVTGEEDFKDPSVVHAAQAVAGFCQNTAVASAGFCKLTAGGKTSQYDFALNIDETVAQFAEDAADGANVGSGALIYQLLPPSSALTSAGGFNGFFSVELSGTDTAGARIAVEGNIFTNLGATIGPQGAIPSQADVNDGGALIAPSSATTTNVTGQMTGPVDTNGRATMTMTIGTSPSQTLTLALYILANEGLAPNQFGRVFAFGHVFAIDITPVATSKQVLSGQFNWLGNFINSTPAFSNSYISGTNIFVLAGIVPGSPAKSNTAVGSFTTSVVSVDVNAAGKVNAGGASPPPPLAGTVTSLTVATNGRAQLVINVGGISYTEILYLDDVNDGNMMGTLVNGLADNTVNFGFFTGQAANNSFNNMGITGTYVIGTATPVLAAVPNGASPLTLTPTGQNGTIFNGTFSAAGMVNGDYSFDSTTGRGTVIATSGQQFLQNTNNVFYVITNSLIVVMGADQNVPADFIAFLQRF